MAVIKSITGEKYMVKRSIKQFFSNGKNFFAVCGVIYLVFLIIICSVFCVAISLIKSLSAQAIEQINSSVNELFREIGESRTVSGTFINEFIANVAQIIGNNISYFAVIFIVMAVLSVLLLALGITYATHLCGASIKGESRKLTLKKSIAAFFLRLFTATVLLAVYFLISAKWKLGIIPLCIVSVFLIICENLFSTWFIYFKNEPLKEFLNFKNALSVLSGYLTVFGCLIVVAAICLLILGFMISLIIIIPLVSYAIGVMDSVSLAYFEEKSAYKPVIGENS